jgi:hypothetical protein
MPFCPTPPLSTFSINGIQVSQERDGRLVFEECKAWGIDELDFGSHRNNEYVLSQLGQTIRFQDVVDTNFVNMLINERFERQTEDPPSQPPRLRRYHAVRSLERNTTNESTNE